jgi:hypothetical protein
VVATAAQGSERGGNFFIAFSVLEKKMFGAVLSILRKHHSSRDTKVSILQFLVTAKHIKIFETVVVLITMILLKYF